MLALAAPGPAGGGELDQAYARLIADYAGHIEELAHWCDAQGLADCARQTRESLPPPDPLVLRVPILSGEPLDRELPDQASSEAAQWQQRLMDLRRGQAEALWQLAGRAAGEQQHSLAWRLAHEAVFENPEHEAARRLLGYRQHEGRWLTAFELAKAQGKQVWHPRFGWLPEGHVPRYESGQRFYKGRWIRAEEEAVLRRDIDRGWEVATEHYLVRTNHSLEEGVRLAERLERLHQVWRQLFLRYELGGQQLARLFLAGSPPRRAVRRFEVVYYRSRDEYVAALKRMQPQIDITSGYYLGPARQAHFFAPAPGSSEEPDDSNLYHEATHQLFSESRHVVRDIGRDANFWVVEGIACYMESLEDRGSYCLLGGSRAIRLGDARFRLLEDGFYLPLAEFTAYGMLDVQRHERIATLYSQASGLAWFLMHYRDGLYRDALIDYLVAVYAGRDRPSTLAELTGQSFAELDEQYREFLQSLEQSAGDEVAE